jgi:hypothetical protein
MKFHARGKGSPLEKSLFYFGCALAFFCYGLGARIAAAQNRDERRLGGREVFQPACRSHRIASEGRSTKAIETFA